MTTNFRDNLYQFITDHIRSNGASPSFTEITVAMGISPRSKSLITRSLRILEKERKPKLTKQGRRLSISLIENQLPLVGRISAGSPIEAIADYQLIDVDQIFRGPNHFVLKVSGTSMIEEGILDGDLIICRKSDVAQEGDIVVSLIDQNNATLKRISYKLKGMVTLIPANPELKPRAYMPERIRIQGIYVGLIRALG